MPDTHLINCFQHRRLSDRLTDISGDDKDANHAAKDYLEEKRDYVDNEDCSEKDIAEYLHEWLSRIEKTGFLGSLNTTKSNYNSCIGNSIIDIAGIGDDHKLIEREEIVETDLTVFREGKPCGNGTITLADGTELWGSFRKGRREGRGSILGGRLEKLGVRRIHGFYSNGVLEGNGRVEWEDGRILQGIFSNGFLTGLCIAKSNTGGNKLYIGEYRRGVPVGPVWRRLEGGGWLHGVVDMLGELTGDDIMYIYPDMITCLVGEFRKGVLISGRESRIHHVVQGDILQVVCNPPDPGSPVFRYQPSDSHHLYVDHQVQDPYERGRVECRRSEIENAGEGVFASRDIPANTVVCFYHGIYLGMGQGSPQECCDYQIYLDWYSAPDSPALDIPPSAQAYSDYKASLGHKVNHSWQPNCMYTKYEHPVFGHTALAVKTIRSVSKGEELTAHYKYDYKACPDWYNSVM